MGNSCMKSCNKKIILVKKNELNVEDIIKEIQINDDKKSIFNSNKKSYYSVGIKNSKLSSNKLGSNLKKSLSKNSSIKNQSNENKDKDKEEKKDNLVNKVSKKNSNLNVLKKNKSKENSSINNKKGTQELEKYNSNKNSSNNSDNNSNNFNNSKKFPIDNSINEKELINLQNIIFIDNHNEKYNDNDKIDNHLQIRHYEINEKYTKLFLEEINSMRKNCSEYSNKIKKLINNIVKEDGNYYILSKQENFSGKTRLFLGIKAFEDAIKILEKNENKNLPCFELIEDLRIPFPYDNIEKFKENNYMKKKFNEIENKLKGKYEVFSYHYDVTFKDAEFSIIMQIVDDNNSNKKRQNNLLNKEYKYIGITCGEISNERISVYLVFAK